MVSDSIRWLRWPFPCIEAPGWRRQHFAQRDLDTSNVLRRKRLEIGAHEATEQGGANVVRMTF